MKVTLFQHYMNDQVFTPPPLYIHIYILIMVVVDHSSIYYGKWMNNDDIRKLINIDENNLSYVKSILKQNGCNNIQG